MKRFLTLLLFSAVLFVGGMGVHAQPVSAQTASSTVSSATPGDSASVSKPIQYGSTQSTDAYNEVMIWIMGIFAWLLGVAALVLDYTMYYTVVVMGNYINHLSSIGVVWKTLRDVSNIVLIFGFMAMGISVMLDTERLGYGKKMLPTLLVVAVFINFSLFVSEAVIDVGNLLATELYTQINGGSLPAVSASGYLVDDAGQTLGTGKEGISNKIMSQLGLTTIYGTITTNPDTAKDLFKGSNPTFMAFMAVLLFITTAFVMFSLSFILIARFVTLILLIIVAPIGFAGLAVPKLGVYATKWWNLLFKKAFEAPVLLLVLYVALKVITDANFLTGFGFSSAGTGANSAYAGFTQTSGAGLSALAGVILSFLVAMGLLIAVTIVAKGMSASGAGFATKWGSKLSGIGLLAGGVGVVSRSTIGAGSRASAKGLRNTAVGRTFIGRGVAGGLENVSKKTFDVRNTGFAKVTQKAGLDMGKGQKGGYEGAVERKADSYKKAVAGIGNARDYSATEARAVAAKTQHNEAIKASAFADASHASALQTHGAAVQKSLDYHKEINVLKEEDAARKASGDEISSEESRNRQAAIDVLHNKVKENDVEVVRTQEQLNAVALANAAVKEASRVAKKEHEDAEQALAAGSAKVRQEAYKGRLAGIWSSKIVGTAGAREYVKKNVKQKSDKQVVEDAIENLVKKRIEEEKAKETKSESGESKPEASGDKK